MNAGAKAAGRTGGDSRRTKAGMSRKTKEMPVYDRPIKVLQHSGQATWMPAEKLGFKI